MASPKTRSLLELEELWSFGGPETVFWGELMRVFCRQIEAASGMVLRRIVAKDSGQSWAPVSVWPDSEETRQRLSGQREGLFGLADTALERPDELCTGELGPEMRGAALGLRLEDGGAACVAVFLRYGSEDFFLPSDRIARLMADSPLIYGADLAFETGPSESSPNREADPLATALQLGILLNGERRFLSAAMMLCNELAARYSADRVSLGWGNGSSIRVRATNHAEKVDRKMETSRLLAAAMEECLDQDDEVVWPGQGLSRSIERDHESYARRAGVANLASVPLRVDDEPVAVVTLERVVPISDPDLLSLRLAADLVARRLEDLRLRDRWFGARWATGLGKVLAKVFGVEHTWVKLAALVEMAGKADATGLRAIAINPVSSSPKAIACYRDLCVIAITARTGAAA